MRARRSEQLDREELWERYRQAAAYAYVATLVTAGLGGMQDEDTAVAGLRRSITALNELDTVPLLQKSPG